MVLVYDGHKYKVHSRVKIPKAFLDEREKGYIYFVRVGRGRLYKIGTTCDIIRRMKEHCKAYKEEIFILWISPTISKYTSERVEFRTKRNWLLLSDWEYLKNDRFIIPPDVQEITIPIKKKYNFSIE